MDPHQKIAIARKWITKYKHHFTEAEYSQLKETLACLLTDFLQDYEKEEAKSLLKPRVVVQKVTGGELIYAQNATLKQITIACKKLDEAMLTHPKTDSIDYLP